jgi:ClpP class serine protease
MELEGKQADRDLKKYEIDANNETKVLVAQMNSFANEETSEDIEYSQDSKNELAEKIRQFNESISLERQKHSDAMEIKRQELQIKKQTKNKIT